MISYHADSQATATATIEGETLTIAVRYPVIGPPNAKGSRTFTSPASGGLDAAIASGHRAFPDKRLWSASNIHGAIRLALRELGVAGA